MRPTYRKRLAVGAALVLTGRAVFELKPGYPVSIGMLYGHRGTRRWVRCLRAA